MKTQGERWIVTTTKTGTTIKTVDKTIDQKGLPVLVPLEKEQAFLETLPVVEAYENSLREFQESFDYQVDSYLIETGWFLEND